MNKKWEIRTPGIPDHYFIRGGVPMTKEEIRVITLAKARLAPGQVVWDIGAGTGSLTVEAALQAPDGFIWAVEREEEGVSLIEQNRALFGLENIQIIRGEAPGALDLLPDPDRVIIGGSGGKLAEIIRLVAIRLKKGGRLVSNSVTLETTGEAISLMQKYFTMVEAVQVSIARAAPAGGRHLLKSLNPVMIISAEKGESGIAG